MIYIFIIIYYIFGICFFIVCDVLNKNKTPINKNINKNLEEPLISTSEL